MSDDGIAENWEDSVNDIIARQNGTHVRSAITESKFGPELSLIETKGEVLEMFHRGSQMIEVAADNFRLDVKPTTPPRRCSSTVGTLRDLRRSQACF